MKRMSILAVALLHAIFAGLTHGEELQVTSALVRLIDQLDIPAQEPGAVAALEVQEGSRVAAGEILARLDDTDARYAVERARIELEIARQNAALDIAVRSAERNLVTAQAELQRALDAREKLRDIVTDSELDRFRLAADQAKLAVEKAKQDQAAARLTEQSKQIEADFAAKKLARRQLVAPFAGTVVQVHKHRGDWVEPGEKLLRLVRLDRLRVEAQLDAKYAAAPLAGRPVSLVVEAPGGGTLQFVGKLVFVSPEIDPFNRQIRVLAEIENPDGKLQPGLRGTLKIAW
ncbi:MAG: efflux RND transporter periplasmic adaptor subunit [Pirellulaceae bacterium]|nr:efflux RND transporter periplasmic adaptor subunit [Pirellulaceae bacterium]